MVRFLRWLFFLTALGSLIHLIFFSSTSAMSLTLFVLCGGFWYYLGRRKLTSLDASSRWKS